MDRQTMQVNKNYHKAASIVSQETGIKLYAMVHNAMREYFEKYYPHVVPVLGGGEVDEDLRPEPFRNHGDGGSSAPME